MLDANLNFNMTANWNTCTCSSNKHRNNSYWFLNKKCPDLSYKCIALHREATEITGVYAWLVYYLQENFDAKHKIGQRCNTSHVCKHTLSTSYVMWLSTSRHKYLWYQLYYETKVVDKSSRSVQCLFINFLQANDNAQWFKRLRRWIDQDTGTRNNLWLHISTFL